MGEGVNFDVISNDVLPLFRKSRNVIPYGKNFFAMAKNLLLPLFMADVFSGKTHHSAVKNDFRCQVFRRFFTISSIGTLMAKNMAYGKKSYGKKSCLNTILKWEKSYHFSLTSNFELAEAFFRQDAYYGKSST